jgi:hypothetical protein
MKKVDGNHTKSPQRERKAKKERANKERKGSNGDDVVGNIIP